MSKKSKFLKNPKKFFLDSMWFKKNNLKTNLSYKNLFVISHLGQLNQVESLIEYEQIENCLLVILYTNKNTKVPKSIQNQYNKNLFDNSILFLLPNSPNNYNTKSLVFIKRNYQELINIARPDNLYLLSFENHYSLLAEVAKESKVYLALIDEGTATYKSPDLSEYYKKQTLIKKLIAKALNVNQAFYWTTTFDNVYGAFPELLKSTFKAKSYNRFFAHAGKFTIDENTTKLINNYNVTDNDFIYVNQRYPIDDTDFVDAILDILEKISKYHQSKIFIKMHPKDSDTLKSIFINKLQDYQNIIFIKENEFLIEPTIQMVKPKGVIGLTSTSLVYAPLVSPKTKVYSIKPWFINLIPTENNQTGIDIINDHFKILQQFKHVIELHDETQLENTTIKHSNKNLNTKIHLDIARSAYEENKYQKAIVNYIWAYPNGIESIPIDDYVKYLNAFWNINGIKLSQDIVNKWVEPEILKNNGETNLNDYYPLINIISNIIDRSNEYTNRIYAKKIYNDILALITTKTNITTFSIKLLDVEMQLLNEYKEKLLPLLTVEAKVYVVESRYQDAINILNKVLNYEEYISNHENLYIYLLKCLINLDAKEKINSLNEQIQEKVLKDEIKMLAESLIAIYKNDYALALNILIPNIDYFTNVDKEDLKPEIVIAKAHILLENYQDAKSYLVLFEKHSKGNIVCHREIAYLNYEKKDYPETFLHINRAYPNGIESMPIKDLILLCNVLRHENNYIDLYAITKNINNSTLQDLHYVAAFELGYWNDFIRKKSLPNLEKVSNFKYMQLQAFRKLGLINEALLILQDKTLEFTDIDGLICKADILELSGEYEKAFTIWKAIIQSYSEEAPHDAWQRYYNLLKIQSPMTKEIDK